MKREKFNASSERVVKKNHLIFNSSLFMLGLGAGRIKGWREGRSTLLEIRPPHQPKGPPFVNIL